jgi:hypothetical protein
LILRKRRGTKHVRENLCFVPTEDKMISADRFWKAPLDERFAKIAIL